MPKSLRTWSSSTLCRKHGALMPPSKRDSLSASITDFRNICGMLCEISCYGSKNDYVCRITQQDSKPSSGDLTDSYYPQPDAGLLWIRSFDSCCMISGFVRKYIAPNGPLLDELIDHIQAMLAVDQVQSVVNIEVVGADWNWNRCFNGEDLDTTY